jgi:hypothetical protein
MRLETHTATIENRDIEHALGLSASRAYDCALEILAAHKLTGNFHVNLEIVLKHLRALDEVSFEVEPNSYWAHRPDYRHVAFTPKPGVHADRFAEILRSVKARIGFDPTRSWWSRAFQ